MEDENNNNLIQKRDNQLQDRYYHYYTDQTGKQRVSVHGNGWVYYSPDETIPLHIPLHKRRYISQCSAMIVASWCNENIFNDKRILNLNEVFTTSKRMSKNLIFIIEKMKRHMEYGDDLLIPNISFLFDIK